MSFVYVMPEVHGPLCKVGFSVNPAARAKRVGAEWQTKVTLYAAIPCAGCQPAAMEHAAHYFLSRDGLHAHHEWFAATPQQALWAIYKAKRYCLRERDENGGYRFLSRRKRKIRDVPLFGELRADERYIYDY